jgi:N-acylneuraminate cytidylyltransferase
MNVAIIPARGGSKRIPRKNIKPFLGKPIIARSIETALASACFDRVIVSTDDEEIAGVSRSFGAETPFMRPAELADDQAATLPVVAHAVNWLIGQDQAPDHVCCIYPTAPLLLPSDVRKGYDLLRSTGADYVISCCAFEFPVQRSVEITGGGFLAAAFPEYIDRRSQDLKPLYHDAGQLYWGATDSYVKMKPFFQSRAVPLILPRLRVQDIDNEEDWARAEFLLQWMGEQNHDQT